MLDFLLFIRVILLALRPSVVSMQGYRHIESGGVTYFVILFTLRRQALPDCEALTKAAANHQRTRLCSA